MAYGNYGEQGNPKRGGPGGGVDPELSASIRAAKLARHGRRPWWKFWAPKTTRGSDAAGPEDPQTPAG
jgi:hypothetical protein